MDGTQIQLSIFRDRLEIISPGGFFQREKIQKTYDLSSIISKRRNELICNVLVKCNAMEASGTGFEKIEEACLSADERHKPYICTESDHFKLVLPDLTCEAGTQDNDIPAVEFIPVADGTKHDKAVLGYYTIFGPFSSHAWIKSAFPKILPGQVLKNQGGIAGRFGHAGPDDPFSPFFRRVFHRDSFLSAS